MLCMLGNLASFVICRFFFLNKKKKEDISGIHHVLQIRLNVFRPELGQKFYSLTLYSIITPFDAYEISCIVKYYGKWNICSFGANAPF